MTRAFSDDLRSRGLAASRDGMSARSAAARFGIGISTAIAWIASARAGLLTPAMQGRRGGSRLEDFIFGMIEEAKDITLNEIVRRLCEERAVSIGRSALDVWLRKRGWTFKKRMARPVARGFYGVLISLRQRIRSHEQAHGQDGHPHVQSPNKDLGNRRHFFDRALQTPFDCQAIFTILPANLVGLRF